MRHHASLVAALGSALALALAIPLDAGCSSGSGGGGSSGGGSSGSGSGGSSGSGSGSGGSSSSAGSSSGAGSSSSASSSSSGAGEGGSGDTWASWAQGFFTTYCIECHSASDPKGLNFTMQSIVVANKDTIRCGVSVMQDPSWNCAAFPPAKQFPISDMAGTNPKPSDAERNRAVAWIDAGCP